MKHLIFLVIALFAAAAFAQDKPAAREEAKPEPIKQAGQRPPNERRFVGRAATRTCA